MCLEAASIKERDDLFMVSVSQKMLEGSRLRTTTDDTRNQERFTDEHVVGMVG